LDANDKLIKNIGSSEAPGFGAGQTYTDFLLKEGFNCDINNPSKFRATVDSTKVISEKLENNNYAESICGAINPGSDNDGAGGDGGETKDDPKKNPTCSAGNALIEISNLSVSEVLDGAGKAMTGNYWINYNLANVHNGKADYIKVSFAKKEIEIPGLGTSLSSLYGCKVHNSRAMYTCSANDVAPEIEIRVNYVGGTTVRQKIKIPCEAGKGAIAIPYCEIDKSISSSGDIRVSQGEKIIYTVKISGYTLTDDKVKIGS